MKGKRTCFAALASCCLAACIALAPAATDGQALASTAGAGGSSVSNASESGSSADEPGSLLDWIFGFLFGKPSSGEASSSFSPAAQAPSSDTDDPFTRPVKSEADAVNRVHDCLMRAGKEVPPKIEFVKMVDGGRYLIHGYEIVDDGGSSSHQATWFYYSVGEDGSIYDEVMMCDIDPLTMEKAGNPAVHANDYYVLSLPPDLADADVTFKEGSFGGPTTAGAITSVSRDGKPLFEIACFSDDWNPQGNSAWVKIGVPSADSSCVVYLTVPAWPLESGGYDYDTANAEAKEYALYIALL